ncbi:T9SS type A sorting domain-containing protein [Aquimarina sediminis]
MVSENTYDVDQKMTINTSDLLSGHFFLDVTFNQQTITKKIIIK